MSLILGNSKTISLNRFVFNQIKQFIKCYN
jgi:hypothetical protein